MMTKYLQRFVMVRDEIKEKVIQFMEEANSLDYWMQDRKYEASEEKASKM